jgi:phenylacetate-CoA ligase
MTVLTSEAQPFIRYRTGDLVRLSGTGSEVRPGLHALEEVAGRQTDFVVRADGTIMHALALIYVLRGIQGVEHFKCVQLLADSMEVLVVPNALWNEGSRYAVVEGLRARLGPELRVEIKLQDTISPEASGKHRYVVSHVPLTAELRAAAA